MILGNFNRLLIRREIRGYLFKKHSITFNFDPPIGGIKVMRISMGMINFLFYMFFTIKKCEWMSKCKRMLRNVPHQNGNWQPFVKPRACYFMRSVWDSNVKKTSYTSLIKEFAQEYDPNWSCGHCIIKKRMFNSFFCSQECKLGWKLTDVKKRVSEVKLEGPADYEEIVELTNEPYISGEKKRKFGGKKRRRTPRNSVIEIAVRKLNVKQNWEMKQKIIKCAKILVRHVARNIEEPSISNKIKTFIVNEGMKLSRRKYVQKERVSEELMGMFEAVVHYLISFNQRKMKTKERMIEEGRILFEKLGIN